MKCLVILTALATTLSPVHAQNINAAEPGPIAQKILDLGYKAELKKDRDGDPVINSAAEDREKVEKIAADWNPDVNFSRAVLKGNNVSLITYLALTQDELSGSLFAYNFNTWVDEHSSFGPRLATAAN